MNFRHIPSASLNEEGMWIEQTEGEVLDFSPEALKAADAMLDAAEQGYAEITEQCMRCDMPVLYDNPVCPGCGHDAHVLPVHCQCYQCSFLWSP